MAESEPENSLEEQLDQIRLLTTQLRMHADESEHRFDGVEIGSVRVEEALRNALAATAQEIRALADQHDQHADYVQAQHRAADNPGHEHE